MWAKIGLFLAGLWTLLVIGLAPETLTFQGYLIAIAIGAVPLILIGCALTLIFTLLVEGTVDILRRSRH